MSIEQPNNPLHGIKLATMLEQLYLEYGWEELGDILNINACLLYTSPSPRD